MAIAPDDIAQQKAALREEARGRRKALKQVSCRAEEDARAHWQDAFSVMPGQVVAGYMPIGSELDCRPLMLALQDDGAIWALPRVVGPEVPLSFHRYTLGDPLIRRTFGVDEPQETAPVVEPDILLVPLLAFDRDGYRLGYGGGFYDRTLSTLRRRKTIVAIGYGFAGQEVAAVPRDAHDAPLDAIVTDQSAYRLER